MIYVVVITGYEGIEDLIWAGEDQVEAVRRVKDRRDRLAKVNVRREELEAETMKILGDGSEDADASKRFTEAELKDYETLKAEFGEDVWLHGTPDHVCVQGYDSATDKFGCCCSDLGVSPSQRMWR
jgi:hypothetical protein